MTGVDLSLVLGFIHNKHCTFHICLLGYQFVLIFLDIIINPKGHICRPDRKSGLEFANKLMNLQSRAHGPQSKLLRLK